MNIDGATKDYPSLTSCVGICRGSRGEYVNNFLTFLAVHTSIYLEFMEIIYA